MNSKVLKAVATFIVVVLAAILGLNVSPSTETKIVTKPVVSHAPQGDLNSPVAPKDDTPPGVNPRQILKGQAEAQRAMHPKPHGVGGAQSYSCPTLYDGHLWSARTTRITEFLLHYTAGNGTAESIDSYFRRTRAASATYILEPSGHCRQEVPESQKPWTQLAANSTSISVEIVTTGYNVSRAGWLAMPIFTRHVLADLMHDSMTRNGIPIRRVDPVGCNFIPGYTDHNALECGNNHTDVLPNFPWDVLAKQLADGPVALVAPPAAVKMCHVFNKYTARLKAKGHLGAYGTKRRRQAQHYFVKNHSHGTRNYDCFSDGHVKVRVVK